MKAGIKFDSKWRCLYCEYDPMCVKPKIFTRKGDLTRHLKIHRGEKEFKCDFVDCGKAFSQRTGLKTHRNVHTKAKPYICGEEGCRSAFGDPSSCARHRKETHRRTGGYCCPSEDCKVSIKRKSVFTAHLKKKHGLVLPDEQIEILLPPSLPSMVKTAVEQIKVKRKSKNHEKTNLNLDRYNEDLHTPYTKSYMGDLQRYPSSHSITWPSNEALVHDDYPDNFNEHVYHIQFPSSADTTPTTSPTAMTYMSNYQHVGQYRDIQYKDLPPYIPASPSDAIITVDNNFTGYPYFPPGLYDSNTSPGAIYNYSYT